MNSRQASDGMPSSDGFFLIREREDGLYITVFPPTGAGRPVAAGDVRIRLADFGVRDLDHEYLAGIVARADGLPHKVGEIVESRYAPEEKSGGETEVHITEDGLKAFLTYVPSLKCTPEDAIEEIYSALSRAGVTHGIDRDLIRDVAKSGRPVRNLVIAEGAEGQPGEKGRLEFHFDTDPTPQPQILPDGRVDYRQTNLIQNVSAGAVILTIVPGSAGQPGIRVDGRMIFPPDSEHAPELEAGDGVKEMPDRRTFTATVDGHARLQDGVLEVKPVYIVEGDVDYATGNLEMKGSVLVKGTVRAGFSVKADDDIEIYGAVEPATVISKNGSIWVHGGIVGGAPRARVGAYRDVVAAFIERASVIAGRRVRVDDAIRDSEISARHEVRVTKGRGQILGGVARSEGAIRALVFGSPGSAFTEVRIEPLDAPKLYARLSELEQLLAALDGERARLETLLLRFPRDTIGANEAIREIESALKEVNLRRRLHASEEIEIERRLSRTSRGEIEAAERIYDNVLVAIGRSALRIKESRGGTKFFREGEVLRWKSAT